MAWRPTQFVQEGELDNTCPDKVTGWIKFADMKDKVTFDLEGNFHRDIRGAKIHFTGDAYWSVMSQFLVDRLTTTTRKSNIQTCCPKRPTPRKRRPAPRRLSRLRMHPTIRKFESVTFLAWSREIGFLLRRDADEWQFPRLPDLASSSVCPPGNGEHFSCHSVDCACGGQRRSI